MKITPEERRLLVQFSGFFAKAVGLPHGKSTAQTCIYVVEQFTKQFDANAELMRAPKTADNLAELARRNDSTAFFEGAAYKPVQSCERRNFPHDHVICEAEAHG